MHNTNIIIIKHVIILEKAREKKLLLENITDIIALAEMAWVLSLINFASKYK